MLRRTKAHWGFYSLERKLSPSEIFLDFKYRANPMSVIVLDRFVNHGNFFGERKASPTWDLVPTGSNVAFVLAIMLPSGEFGWTLDAFLEDF